MVDLTMPGPSSLGVAMEKTSQPPRQVPAYEAVPQQASQTLYNQTLINALMSQQQQISQSNVTSELLTQNPMQGAYALPTVQPAWNDPQIHLASATGKSVGPYYDICDFVPSR